MTEKSNVIKTLELIKDAKGISFFEINKNLNIDPEILLESMEESGFIYQDELARYYLDAAGEQMLISYKQTEIQEQQSNLFKSQNELQRKLVIVTAAIGLFSIIPILDRFLIERFKWILQLLVIVGATALANEFIDLLYLIEKVKEFFKNINDYFVKYKRDYVINVKNIKKLF